MKTKFIIIQNRILWIIVISLAAMWLMPWGSFSPTKSGFYMSILFGVFMEITIPWVIAKYRVKGESQS